MENRHYPISVEKLAAFLDGNLPEEEMKRISDIIDGDDVLRAVVDVSDHVDDAIAFGGDLLPDYSPDDIDIPDISGIGDADLPGDGILEEGDEAILRENVEAFLESEAINESFGYPGDSSGDESDSIISETDINTSEAMSTQKIYGYEPNYELDKFDPFIFQGHQRTCSIRSQQIVLRDYGIMLSQEQLKEYAQTNGWFDPDPQYGGTMKEHVGNLLDACGIKTTRVEGATIYDIIAELRAGHRVIVGVDADELWIKKEPNLLKRLFGENKNRMDDSFEDFLGLQGANHTLVVAGVSVNPSDPSDIHVTLMDPGTGDVCIEYVWKDFENAWSDSNHSMIATNEPAPFQYNHATHQMEPSGFDTDYMPSQAVTPDTLDNTFTLPEEYYQMYGDHQNPYCEEEPIPYDATDDSDDTDEEGFDNIFMGDFNTAAYSEEPVTESFGEEGNLAADAYCPEHEEPASHESSEHDEPGHDDSEANDSDMLDD